MRFPRCHPSIHHITMSFNSKVEYKAMLYRMNIAYSAKKWTLIFAEIDRNYDGFVSRITFFVVALSVAS
jgi:hypothetical protein